MKELLRTNDPVLLSYVEALLNGEDIGFVVLDQNMSVLEGSIGVLPRRVMVDDADIATAKSVIKNADIDVEGE